MDDFAKQASSYQLDQEILDARGINMTVEEVAGLPTCKYSERVHSLHLSEDDLVFLKGLRRRIKNRLASQNSRRRSTEQLRRLARELRALRASRHAALAERRALLDARGRAREHCRALREYVVKVLNERSDPTAVPDLEPERLISESHSDTMSPSPEPSLTLTKSPSPVLQDLEKDIFECRIEKLVQQSVNHIYKEKKKVTAKTVFLEESRMVYSGSEKDMKEMAEGEVLNLSLKRRSHGRKQTAPRRIAYVYDNDDGVLDLKIKKENP